jgi:ornithine cyclodeaminase/alanine dehydrogenase-like protein (mu-crystallin family)
VVTATPARSPLVVADWLHAGLHITAIGADAPDKNELHPAVLPRADRLVCDSRAQCARQGELHHALSAHPDLQVTELGEITASRQPGRQDADEITVADLTGVGIQDAAVANVVVAEAMRRGVGRTLEI